MLNFIKSSVIFLFLSKEVAALKSRLAEATAALDKIEKEVISVPVEASAEVHALGERVLGYILTSADDVRSMGGSIVHAWAQKLYAIYAAGKNAAGSTLSRAEALIKATEVFFASKF